jgi:hypothetical protein
MPCIPLYGVCVVADMNVAEIVWFAVTLLNVYEEDLAEGIACEMRNQDLPDKNRVNDLFIAPETVFREVTLFIDRTCGIAVC